MTDIVRIAAEELDRLSAAVPEGISGGFRGGYTGRRA